MFTRSIAEVREELEEKTRALLLVRGRAGLALLLASDVVFALGDLGLARDGLGVLLALKAIQIGFIVFGFVRLAGRPDVRRIVQTALVVAGSNFVLSAAVGVVRGAIETLPLVGITLAMASATLLPWGARPQATFTGLAAAALLAANVAAGDGLATSYPTIAALVAFVVSVYVAHAFDQNRLALEQRNIELRGYRDVVENANDAILTLDAGHRITGANPAAEAIFGFPPAELVGRPLARLLSEDDAALLRERWAKVLAGAKREAILSLVARRKTGGLVPIEVKARPLADGGLQAILRDVREKRAVEEMRNDFVAMLSHDIKTPIISILGFAEMLADRLVDRRDLRALLDRIDANARVAHSLAVNFVDVARIENGSLELQLEQTSLNDVVGHVLSHQESMARAREVSLEARLDEDLPSLALDPRHMDRVVANLVSNAIKFAPARSAVRVESRFDRGRVVLSVRDAGPGIPNDEIPHLFERYRRCRSARGDGSGLGLYIVKQIVEAHGGVVGVDCPVGGGSIFEISFRRPDALAA